MVSCYQILENKNIFYALKYRILKQSSFSNQLLPTLDVKNTMKDKFGICERSGRREFSKRYLRNVIEGKPGNTSNRIAFRRTKDRVQKVRSMRQGCQVFSHEFCCEENKMITSV
jgi:IS1 family transposase